MPPTIQEQVRQEIANLLGAGLQQGRKDNSTWHFPGAPAGPYNTGPGGLLNLPGVNQQWISLVMQPQGLGSQIPAHASMYANPEWGYITGFTGATGLQPVTVCDDAPQPGAIVTGTQTSHFGLYRFDTKPVALNRVGLMNNAADTIDFTLLNGPLAPMFRNLMPSNVGVPNFPQMVNPKLLVASRMADVAREFAFKLAQQVFYGDPNCAECSTQGGYLEFVGLDKIIQTPKVDARYGTPMHLLNADIKNFNYWDVTRNGGQDLVNALSYIVKTRKEIARKTNMGQVTWKFVMKEVAFNEIAKVWPCAMAANGCLVAPNGIAEVSVVSSLDQQYAMRLDMLNNQYLPIEGFPYPVVFEDALIEEDRGSGAVASDIYFLPFTVRGGMEVLFWEYLDYSQGAILGAQQGRYGPGTFFTDDGQFLWWNKPNNNVCIQLGSMTERRIVLLTPNLAGALLNVVVTPLQHAPDPFPGQPYYDLSGVTHRPEPPNLYSDSNPNGPGMNPNI